MNRASVVGLVVLGLGVTWGLVQAGCAGGLHMPGSLGVLGQDLPDERVSHAATPAPTPVTPTVTPRPSAPVTPPSWLRVEKVTEVGVPPGAYACDGAIDLQAPVPGGPATAVPVADDVTAGADAAPSPFDTATMLRFEPGGDNPALPETIRTSLGLGAPFVVDNVPLEPLRGSESARARVRDALARAATPGSLTRFAAWGASHVAGEFFTGEVRRVLQDRWGDGGHGLLMPAPPWTGYRRNDVNLCAGGTWATDFAARVGGRGDGLLGPTGMRVEPLDANAFAWVSTTASNPHGRSASRLGVLWLRQPGARGLSVSVDGGAPRAVDTSGPTGPGGLEIHVPDGGHRIEIRGTDGEGPAPAVLGVTLERDAGFVLDAMGVNGRTAASWLAWDERLLADTLAWRAPALIVLAYGTNEAADDRMTSERYRATLRMTLAKVRRVLPDAACVLVGPSDRGKELRRGDHVIWAPTASIAAVQREVAPEFDCLSWDLQAVTGGQGSVYRWRESDLAAPDLIHFTAAGYREVARRFVRALDDVAAAPTATPSP